MRAPRIIAIAALAGTAITALPSPAAAQGSFFSFQGVYGRAVGDFRDHVRHGGGVDLSLGVPVRDDSPLGIRVALGALGYGAQSNETCLTSGRGCSWHTVHTTNELAFGSLGPQLTLPIGPFLTYGNVGVGATWFATYTRVQDMFDAGRSALLSDFSSVNLNWQAGGGVAYLLDANSGILLDLGVRYLANGPSQYLTRGDAGGFPREPSGATPTRSDANMLLFQIGLAVAVR